MKAAADANGIWAGVERLVARAPSVEALASHGLEPFAARLLREQRRTVPLELRRVELAAKAVAEVAPLLLADVREVVDGELLVVKGPEVAARYPDVSLRPFADLDLVVRDTRRAQRALIAAGFVETGDPLRYAGGPHERPLARSGAPLRVELHSRLNWPRWLEPPSVDELLGDAVPGNYGLDDVVVLPPAQHTLVLAAHAWTHGPLAAIRNLIDVAAVAAEADPREVERLAAEWRLERLWNTVRRAADALLADGPPPWALRVWARHLLPVRERTVLESHTAAILAPFSALPAGRAARAMAWQLGSRLRPSPGERWPTKLRRARRALLDARTQKSVHDKSLDPEREGGARLPPRRRVSPSVQEARQQDDRDRHEEQ